MNEPENKREYEMAYLLTAETAEDKLESEISALKDLIVKNGGEVTSNRPLELRRLAYPVKKQNQAYFGVLYFSSNGEAVEEIKRALILDKKIIRNLIITGAAKPEAAKPADSAEKRAPSPESFDQKLEDILKR